MKAAYIETSALRGGGTSVWGQCLYCGSEYPPATRSREHVLPDTFGIRMRLPDGAVCKDCNNQLNIEIDQKLKILFQAPLAYFGLESSKKRRDSGPTTGHVTVKTKLGPLQSKITANGILIPQTQPISRESVGNEIREQWLCSSRDDAENLIKRRRSECESLDVRIAPAPQIEEVTAPLQAKWELLIRATARAGINYLAHRRPFDACNSALLPAKSYILHGTASGIHLPALGPKALTENVQISSRDMKPLHRIAVGAEGNVLRSGILLFAAFWVDVDLSETWTGESFHAEEEFDARSGKFQRVDRGFIHPKDFKIVLPNQ